MGGPVKQHPDHNVIWGSIAAGLAAIGIGLALATHSLGWRILGYICITGFVWIAGSFVFPFKLLPLRDVEIVKARREQRKHEESEALRMLAEALEAVTKRPEQKSDK